jgi:hypothetical protein
MQKKNFKDSSSKSRTTDNSFKILFYYKKRNCANARFLTVVVVEAHISMIDAKVDS